MRTKLFLLFPALIFASLFMHAQVSINNDGSAPHSSAMLEVKSTNMGLLIPRLTTAQRNTLAATATAGLMVYDTDLELFFYYDGSGWKEGAFGNYWDGNSSDIFLNDINDNVGIGTASPNRKLEIDAGSAWRSARISTIASGAFLEFVSNGDPDWSIGEWNGSLRILSSTNDFSSSTDEYFITQGEFRPFSDDTKSLGVSGSRWSNLYSVDGDFSGALDGNTASFSGNLDGTTASFSGLLSSSTANFTGQVAVGTQDFLGALHVHDDVNQTSSLFITPVATGSEDSSRLFLAEDDDATYGMYWLYNGTSNYLELWGEATGTTHGPHLLVQRNDGNIAIGEEFATGYRLSVDGKIICTEMRVNLVANWPDYVFKDDYQLMPLDHLRDFIKQNGHLPNVPTAGRIEEAGMDVGEMQRLMMEKIEELSLYILMQQEQINELENKLENIGH